MWLLLAGCERPRLACDDAVGASDLPIYVPEVDVTAVVPGRSEVAEGYLLLNAWDLDHSAALVVDGCGNPWWGDEAPDPGVKINRTRPGRDGESVLYSVFDRYGEADPGTIVRMSLVDGSRTETEVEGGHHDFVELPDGRMAWLAWDTRTNRWFDRSHADIASDRILVTPEGSSEPPTELFAFFNHYEPFWSCSHMAEDESFLAGHLEWTHSNSLAYDDDSGAFFVAVRNWDAVLRIEADGTPGWQLGGPHNEFLLAPGTQLPQHGHASELGPDRMLFFDNGNHAEDPESRVVEYDIDAEGRWVTSTWSWQSGDFSDFLGDARTLPGGHVLVSKPGGTLIELDRDGHVVWKAKVDAKIGRVSFLPTLP